MAGTYTDISIVAPDKAVPGSVVSIEAKITNLSELVLSLIPTGLVGITELYFGYDGKDVAPGQTESWYDSFIMPGGRVKVTAWSWYWGVDDEWHFDDECSKWVEPDLPPPEGTISRKELEYDETQADIPVFGIAQAKYGKVHIWGRNDTDTPKEMGIFWEVKDPDGEVIQTYWVWDLPVIVNPGDEYEFISPTSLHLFKVGTYTILVSLFIEGKVVSSYRGDLCTTIPIGLAGELEIGWVQWVGKGKWNMIGQHWPPCQWYTPSPPSWPANTELTTVWTVLNIGSVAAYFKVKFMGLESAGVYLSPGKTGSLYLYPVTPGPGSYSYTVQVIVDSQVVDEVSIDVKIYAEEPELAGKIIKKELEYSGSGDGTVPVSNVPQGVSAKLHVWGKNDMVTSQPIGIYWFVYDPDGGVAEEYTDWKFGTLGPGQDHEFISSGSFTLNKVGKYTTWIKLLMGSEDDPEIVDQYFGELCTVVTELVPTFTELKISSFNEM